MWRYWRCNTRGIFGVLDNCVFLHIIRSYNILKYICVCTHKYVYLLSRVQIYPTWRCIPTSQSNACTQVSSHRNNVHPSVASSLAFSALLAATLGRFEGP